MKFPNLSATLSSILGISSRSAGILLISLTTVIEDLGLVAARNGTPVLRKRFIPAFGAAEREDHHVVALFR